MQHFLDLVTGSDAHRHQRDRHSFDSYQAMVAEPAADGLGVHEAEFLAARDSFYISSVTETGWPYVQHRGGPAGFVKVIDPTHIAWADRSGNRQFVSAGNLDHDGRIAIIAVDYPNRTRLKILGRARFEPDPPADQLSALGIDGRLEGLITVEVAAFDWNCPKYITPRYTVEQIQAATAQLVEGAVKAELPA